MKTFGQEVKDKPSFSTEKINNLRVSLIEEELKSLDAMESKDLLEVADALTDILCDLWSWTCFWDKFGQMF